MEYEIKGVINQTLSVSLDAGEAFWASKGMIVSYDETIGWGVKTLGGVGRTVSRMLSGESLALAYGEMADADKSVDDEINAVLAGSATATSSDALLELKKKMGIT